MKEKLELLAPVGSFDALRAAIQNGANAVYLGGQIFSARASAANFDNEALEEAVIYAHIRKCRVFVTVNTLIKESEKEDFIDYIGFLYNINVDALILQDIGMARLIRGTFPDFELHASTQMAAHSLRDVEFLQDIGFSRVVLARELSVDEIAEICKKSRVDIEVFVHGALCVAYSGQCLMSTSLGTRSGNRGRCAQPCRKKYRLLDLDNNSYVETEGDYLLSPRDLNSIENVGKLIEAGIYSFKIEGRMKKAEYVATVVSRYRKAIDNYIDGSTYNPVSKRDVDDLYSIFNREFTSGYLDNKCGSDIMNSEKPNNKGLYIGKAVAYDKKKKRLKIRLEKDLNKGDGLNIGGGDVGRIIIGREIFNNGVAGQNVEIDFPKYIGPGTDIYKTNDSILIENSRKTFSEDKENIKFPISARMNVRLGENAVLSLIDGDTVVKVKSQSKAEKALKVELTKDKINNQLEKLGNTIFYLESVEVDIGDGLSMPISEMNRMRREAVELLYDRRLKIKRSMIVDNTDKYFDIKGNNLVDWSGIGSISISCWTIDQLKAALDLNVNRIYFRSIKLLEEAIDIYSEYKNKGVGTEFIIYLPRIVRLKEDSMYNKIEKIVEGNLNYIDGFRISNYGQIKYVKEHYPQKNIDVSSWMNILNDDSIGFYKSIGADIICLSQECSINQLNLLGDKENIEYMVYGHTEMMISEYCPMGVLTKSCKRDKRDALCSKIKYSLESENGEKFMLSQDENCRTTIYSDECVNLLADIEELNRIGIVKYELSMKFEGYEETRDIIKAFTRALEERSNSQEIGEDVEKLSRKYKRIYGSGHLYKEIE